MTDSPEVIRQQMEETKSQLSDKLESLEQQVTESVQSTGTAVSATVGAVQETVQSVTGAVQDAVQTVSNAFDLRRQIDRHPWLVVGGSVAVGYLLSELLSGPKKNSRNPVSSAPFFPAPAGLRYRDGTESTESTESGSRDSASSFNGEQGSLNSYWSQITTAVVGPIMEKVQELASRAVPQLIDQLTESLEHAWKNSSHAPGPQTVSPGGEVASEEGQRLHIASSERLRYGNSF